MKKSIYVLMPVADVATADEAEAIAINWQDWQSEQALSIGELSYFNEYFRLLADKFPELTDEFEENAII